MKVWEEEKETREFWRKRNRKRP
uniref:Ras-related protein RABD2A n=1 Tax=Rhizophora mucronata TaxID=61149 RepID=A0A2P2JBC7_RHIMU